MNVTGAVSSAGKIRSDYLNLLITQLRNQNPLEPLDSNEMTAQLAQLSELEQLEGMGQTFQAVLAAQQKSQAAALLGKEVSFFTEDGGAEPRSGRVESVDVSAGGVCLKVGNYLVGLDAVQTIRE